MWEGAQADLSGILSAVKDDVLYFMETTKTPLPAISDAVQQSAEGAANIKEGDAFKTERTQKRVAARSEEHTSELQSLMRISYAVFCLQKKKQHNRQRNR